MRRILTLVLIGLLPLVLLWPLPQLGSSHVLAGADQEAAPHIWGFWAALQSGSPMSIEGSMARHPEGVSLPLVDPAHLAAYQLGQQLSPALGYNLVLLQGFWILGLAGALMARRAGGSARVGAIVAMLSAPMLAAPASGMTEAMGAGWVGIQLVLLLDWLDNGRIRSGVLAAITLAICALSGPYNGVWAGLLDLGLGIWWMTRGAGNELPWKQRIRPLWIALGASSLVAPLAASLGFGRDGDLPGSRGRGGIPEAFDQPDIFRGGIQTGADLSDPFLPGWLTGGEAEISHTAYLGLWMILLAALAWRRLPRTRPWFLASGGMILLSFGPHWHLWGRTLQLSEASGAILAPAGWLMHIEPLDRLTHWYRAGAIAHLLLVPPVVLLLGSFAVRIRGICVLGLAADLLLCAPLQWPLHHAPLPDASLLQALPDTRALLEIPPVSSDRPPPGHWRDQGALLQVQHGHATGGSPMGLGVSVLARSAQSSIETLMRTGQMDTAPLDTAMDQGFGWVVIYPAFRPIPLSAESHLEHCLGSPWAKEPSMWIFALGRSFPSSCSLSRE